MNQNKPTLKLDWCSYKAAKFAVEYWHYSGSLPSGKLTKIGVWESNRFIGCIIFSRGANNNLLRPYGLLQTEGCELTRVALSNHITPVTQLLSIAIKMLRRFSPKLQLIVSFADNRQKHLGIIYQAGNWIYTGYVHTSPEYYINERWQHQRNVNSLFGTIKGISCPKRDGGFRYRYLYPLNNKIKKQIEELRLPYPKSLRDDVVKEHNSLPSEKVAV